MARVSIDLAKVYTEDTAQDVALECSIKAALDVNNKATIFGSDDDQHETGNSIEVASESQDADIQGVMNPEVGTPQVAIQVPSSKRAKYLSTEYPYLSLDNETQHSGFLDMAKIFGPHPDRLDFTFTASWYTGQYSTISIKINGATTSGQR
ncbi:hypothetical protein B0T26DRAFT_752264 [Lasiosphaeria miniovina]|uniref:Uncharacterized protein n=1 Tax=Lasiosphaeria miniovina TaxID=1954250 RepID=A0AA40AM95_9PEZI|nr:uncharacterized protein B0T26DRAFT_752264 [Lasiosphaeria miniovina]KAK0718332.1 hypothetical protein B0T26DRAFT_752264 [Lasiosphaeria miniovina]